MSGDWRTRMWEWARGRHTCRWTGPPGEDRCDWVLDRHDPPTCPDHTPLPNCRQEFWRKPRTSKLTSTEETP